MIVQTSQVIFEVESHKTLMSPITNTDDAMAVMKQKKEEKIHPLRLVLSWQLLPRGMGMETVEAVGYKKGKIGHKSVTKQQKLHTDL